MNRRLAGRPRRAAGLALAVALIVIPSGVLAAEPVGAGPIPLVLVAAGMLLGVLVG